MQLDNTLKNECLIYSCKKIHKFNCFINALKNTLHTAVAFNKVLVFYFFISIIKDFRNNLTFKRLILKYWKIAGRPTLFSMITSFFARYSICSTKNIPSLMNKNGVIFLSILTGNGIWA